VPWLYGAVELVRIRHGLANLITECVETAPSKPVLLPSPGRRPAPCLWHTGSTRVL